MKKKVSIVILNWNGVEMLRRFLPSVIKYSSRDDVEICVADNASTDTSVQMLRHEFPEIRLIILDCNYGFAEGYNKAFQYIEAEYVVLLNSDVEVSQGWLDPLLEYMDTHPDTAACQPKLLNQRNKEYFEYAGAAGGFLDYYGYPYCRGRIFDVVEKDEGQYEDVVSVFWVTGAAMFIRLADYREAGGLDKLFFAHMEEIDLCWRLKNRGKTLVCVPESVVYHVGGATLNKDNPRKTFLNFRNNLLMLYKNLSEQDLNRVLWVRRWLDLLAVIVFLLKRERKNALAVFRAYREFNKLRPSYMTIRNENLFKTTTLNISERSSSCILWKFHICRKRFFSQL